MIDSHCHLDHKPLFDDLENILKRSKDSGIKKLLTICTTFESFVKIKQLVQKDEIIYGTYGIHPHEAKNDKVNSDIIIKESSASTIANNDFVAGSLGSSAYMAACTSTVAKKSKIKL